MKQILLSLSLFLGLLMNRGSAQEAPMPGGQIQFYAMWNEQYFYLAARVDDPNVVGTHGRLMSDVWNDDDFEIFIETDHAGASTLTDRCFRLAASARGGAGVSFYQGLQGQWTPNPNLGGLKLEVAVQGTLNQPEDTDQGYIIEMGLPWGMLGGRPLQDRYPIGFNIVKYMRGERDAFYSYSPLVQTEEQLAQPSAWGRLIFKKTPQIRPLERGTLSCIWTDEIPVIDGHLEIGEWKLTSYATLAMEASLIHPVGPPGPAPRPAPIEPGPEPTPRPAPVPEPDRGPYTGENLVLAPYYYWYQGDERHPSIAGAQVRYPDGRSRLSLKPLQGAGPWFSTLRVGWHRQQLSEVRRGDIDVLLPVYYADAESRRNWSIPGLVSLMMALRELDRWQREYPLVGMCFVTESLHRELGPSLDLTRPAHRARFYGAIREFFWHVPRPYRAVITDGPRRACIVALSSPEPLAGADDSLLEECSSLFRRDFGCDLIWLASPAWQTLGLRRIDGYASLEADLRPHRFDTARLTLASLEPGYDNTAMPRSAPLIRSRMASQTLKEDLAEVLGDPVHWLILTDWNNYQTGSNFAPSREFGVRYVDLASLCAFQFNGGLERNAKYLRHTTPARMLPGGTYQVELRLTNAGLAHWTLDQDIYVSYRWYKEGRLVEEEGQRTGPIAVRRSQSKTIRATVKAAKKDGTPLEAGLYELRWDLVARDIDWFSLRGDRYFSVPVEVTTLPSYAGRILAADTALRLETGRTYPVKVVVRNEGVLPWRGFKLGYQWEQVSGPPMGEPEAIILKAPDAPEQMPQVSPGELLDFHTQVTLTQEDGVPLEPTGDDSPHLFLRWFLTDAEGQKLPDPSGLPYRQLVQVIPRDYGVVFADRNAVPTTMEAGKIVEVQPTVQNSAFVTWRPEEWALSYHWYYWDGIEAVWEGLRTSLPQPLGSGQKLAVPMKIQAPPYPGQYTLVLDLVNSEGVWTSHAPSTSSGDWAPIHVLVTGGRCSPVDLSKVFNVDGISFDLDRTDGNFDGTGATFPAEMMPPDVIPPGMPISEERLYPCGYWGPQKAMGSEGPGRIPFHFPSQLDGEKNFVSCMGQRISFPADRYVRLHLLGAATVEGATGSLLLHYRSEQSVELAMSLWEVPPTHGEHIAFMALHRHRPEGDEVDRKGYLFHYVLNLDPTQPLKALTLPQNPAMRFLAMTLEKPAPEETSTPEG